ncbi:hypothetical protein T484DRAFT_1610601 [Baffinella frigidus]|nr:hypothetical protein T484DRAFT_1610601 [Cryptophyta sp. CCMP2293]
MPRSRSRSRQRSAPRGRSRSGGRRDNYERSPERGGRGGDRSPPRGGGGGAPRNNDMRISLLVRNIADDTSPQELRDHFSKFGMIKDVYVPLDFHTRRPKTFAFMEFVDYEDACKAKEKLDRSDFQGRMIDVVFAQQKRKAPDVMRARDGPPPSRGGGGGRYSRSPQRRGSPPRRYSRSVPLGMLLWPRVEQRLLWGPGWTSACRS